MRLRSVLMGAAAGAAVATSALGAAHEGERGRDGQLNIIYWQAPSTLNPYLSGGTKEVESASLVIEPLARFVGLLGDRPQGLGQRAALAQGGADRTDRDGETGRDDRDHANKTDTVHNP